MREGLKQDKLINQFTCHELKRIWILLLIPISFIIWNIAESYPVLMEEIFCQRFYKWVSLFISKLTGIAPFSVGEICIIMALCALLGLIIFFFVQLRRRKGRRREFLWISGVNILCGFSIILFTYTTLCKVNYYRLPFSHFIGLTVEDSSLEELYGLCNSLQERANELRSQMEEDDQGIAVITENGARKDFHKLSKTAVLAYDKIAVTYPILGGDYAGPKPLLTSKLYSRMETTGIFLTITMEANVNIDIPEYTIPFTICHEQAHQRGFMREDEANYISYLVCSQSEDRSFQYSGVIGALIHASNQLYNQDKMKYMQLKENYSDKVLRDLAANSGYWAKFEGKLISKVADKVNDTYLKSNDQQHGIKSYGRMVDLLLAEYRRGLEQ